MTKETYKFICNDGSSFYQTFFVKDDESSKDIIESFIYQYNKTEYRIEKFCPYIYALVAIETIK